MSKKNCDKLVSFDAKKTYLKRYQRTLAKVQRLSSRIDDLNDDRFDDNDHVLLSETQERIKAMSAECDRVRKEIYTAIDRLENYHEIEILEMFFIFGYDFERIADEKCYSVRHVIRTYSRAIRNLDI